MKKLLIITYHFPPDNAVGGLRWAKFSRYLPKFGWKPYVLTVKDEYREQFDLKRADDVVGMQIYKTRELPTVDQVYQQIKKIYRTVKKSPAKSDIAVPGAAQQKQGHEGVFKKIKRHLISLIIMLPDQKKSWLIPAYLKALRLIKSEGITHIVTSSPHHSTHLIGLLLKKTVRVQWVADFRDPWTDVADFKAPSIRSKLGDLIEGWMENSVVRNSDLTLVTTEAVERIFRRKYGDKLKNRFLYIPNAIFTEKFNKYREQDKYETFTITYTGTLYGNRSPEPVFRAVKELTEEGRIDRGKLKIKLLGNCRNVCGVPTTNIVKAFGLEDIVEILDPVPFEKAVEVMCKSHLLLLLAPNQPLQIPAKVYDYMGSGTDILNIAEMESATADLVKSTGAGYSLTHDDNEGIKDCIIESMRSAASTKMNASSDRLKDFDIMNLTNRLADKLSSLEAAERD